MSANMKQLRFYLSLFIGIICGGWLATSGIKPPENIFMVIVEMSGMVLVPTGIMWLLLGSIK